MVIASTMRGAAGATENREIRFFVVCLVGYCFPLLERFTCFL